MFITLFRAINTYIDTISPPSTTHNAHKEKVVCKMINKASTIAYQLNLKMAS